ncbi:MAG: hypothetical protein ACRCTJ_05700, partial [Brevinema sp.]
MRKLCLCCWLLVAVFPFFAQESTINTPSKNNTSEENIIPLKFRGSMAQGVSIAVVISNRAPFAPEISEMMNDLTMRGYRVALVKDELDIEGL